jgi:hypothetical protein
MLKNRKRHKFPPSTKNDAKVSLIPRVFILILFLFILLRLLLQLALGHEHVHSHVQLPGLNETISIDIHLIEDSTEFLIRQNIRFRSIGKSGEPVGRLRQGDFSVAICVDLGEQLAGI